MYKVLILSYYFPPMGLSGVQRTAKFVKYMPQFNWQPTVITTGKTAYFAHDLALLKEVEATGVEIIRTEAFDLNSVLGNKYGTVTMPQEFIRKLMSNISKALFIPDNKFSWAKKAYEVAREKLKNEHFDILYVTIPPFSPFSYAAKLKKEFDIPLFVDYRDLWFGNHFAFYPTPYHKYKHKKLEYAALKASTKAIVINRRIKEKLITMYKFLTFDDVNIIPHGFDQEDFDKEPVLPKDPTKMKISYAGIFYETITPEYFLKAFKKLTVERPDIASNIKLEFIGHLRKKNKKLITSLGLNQYVIDLGYMEHPDVIKRLKSTDVLWMMIGESKNSETISTGKLFEYLGSRKPILGCVPDGAAKTALTEYGASYITNPYDIDEIKNAIIKINADYKSGSLPIPKEEFVIKHDRKYLTEQLVKSFQFYLRLV
ncbi:MAG: glycosyltransferase [Ignavibacteriaceae bacterium]|nr:glycosyltransferase [Ignavibacteriaceae bacterium]